MNECLNPNVNIESLDKENWHLCILTSRYIFVIEIPYFPSNAQKIKIFFFLCDLKNWQKHTNKHTSQHS
jgi:hypothetical protein